MGFDNRGLSFLTDSLLFFIQLRHYFTFHDMKCVFQDVKDVLQGVKYMFHDLKHKVRAVRLKTFGLSGHFDSLSDITRS